MRPTATPCAAYLSESGHQHRQQRHEHDSHHHDSSGVSLLMAVQPAPAWSGAAAVLHRASDPGSSRPAQPSSPPCCFPMRANHLASKFPWASAPGCASTISAFASGFGLAIGIVRNRRLCIQQIVLARWKHAWLSAGIRLCAFEPPANATMILKASACLRTSTSGRRSDDRTNTSAHLTAVLRCIASPAQALPKRTTQLLKR